MLLIKFMFTLVYYGSFMYTIYKVWQIQQEYSDIMAVYKQEGEHAFPNLTEQKQKRRKKAISQYYEKKGPFFCSKKKIFIYHLRYCLFYFGTCHSLLFPY